jgi:hypothetical protein
MASDTRWRASAKQLLLTAAGLLVAFLLGEAVTRLILGVPMLDISNFRNARFIAAAIGDDYRYDPVIGWALQSGIDDGEFTTIDEGIRLNGGSVARLPTGGVLAVGGSLTLGGALANDETWPAALESLIGRPVVNGGVGHFAFDQAILRVERLLPLLRSDTVVIGLSPDDIAGVTDVIADAPKPYHQLDGDRTKREPVLRNVPVPYFPAAKYARFGLENLRWMLGYSVLIDRIGARYPDSWLAARRGRERTGASPAEVTCALLDGLKRGSDQRGLRVILLFLYPAYAVTRDGGPGENVDEVAKCADAMSIQGIDSFPTFQALLQDPARFAELYAPGDGNALSPSGNQLIAKLVAAGLAQPPLVGSADRYVRPIPVAGDGINLIPHPEALGREFVSGVIADLEPVKGSAEEPQVFRLAARGGLTEHYAASPAYDVPSGAMTVSLEILPQRWTSEFLLQLLDSSNNGVFGRVVFSDRVVAPQLLGRVRRVHADIKELPDGWYRVTVSAALPDPSPRIILQLIGRAGSSFAPRGEAILLRAVKLERGELATPYRKPG